MHTRVIWGRNGTNPECMWRILRETSTWTEMRGGKNSSGLSPIAGFGISSMEYLVYNTIHCEVYLATGPKRVVKRVGFSVSSFKFQFPLFYSRSSSSCLVFYLIFSSLHLFMSTGISTFYTDSVKQRHIFST